MKTKTKKAPAAKVELHGLLPRDKRLLTGLAKRLGENHRFVVIDERTYWLSLTRIEDRRLSELASLYGMTVSTLLKLSRAK